jgi:DedD protein
VSHIQDEGFHEIQLNGKQLVFLFIAATVVSVVIFLCGVLVGRGVRAGQSTLADASATSTVADTSPQQPPAAPVPTPAGSDPTAAPAPPAPADDLSYFDRLQKPNTPGERLKPPSERSAAVVERPAQEAARETTRPPEPSAAVERPAPPAPRETPPPPAPKEAAQAPAADAARPEPTGQGFAVQIAALNIRSEADAIARRLSSKGYAAYVLPPADGTPSVYRVRIGKFPTRREAESIAVRLQKEEQFKPWVTR